MAFSTCSLGVLNADISTYMENKAANDGIVPFLFSSPESSPNMMSTGYLEDALIEFSIRFKRRRLMLSSSDHHTYHDHQYNFDDDQYPSDHNHHHFISDQQEIYGVQNLWSTAEDWSYGHDALTTTPIAHNLEYWLSAAGDESWPDKSLNVISTSSPPHDQEIIQGRQQAVDNIKEVVVMSVPFPAAAAASTAVPALQDSSSSCSSDYSPPPPPHRDNNNNNNIDNSAAAGIIKFMRSAGRTSTSAATSSTSCYSTAHGGDGSSNGDKYCNVNKVATTTRVAYPFSLVKPGGINGDITLNDINQRILMPPTRPVRHPVGDYACPPCVVSPHGPGLSGKAVVALTKIHTQGRGTITIIRTKG